MLAGSATICHMSADDGLDMTIIGKRIFARREEKRLDQQALADQAGLSRAYISRLERGIVPNPKVMDLTQVARVLGVTMAELVRPDTANDDEQLRLSECADLLGQLTGEPPAVVETVMRWWRDSITIAKLYQQSREN